jgi:adenylate kinase family enzyme
MRRVLVIGSGGAGKSTFAARLARHTNLPLVHLDAIYWRAGWVRAPKDVWDREVDALLAAESWIIDGNYSGTLAARLAACDTVVFLDVPRMVCLARVLRRWLLHRGRTRPGVAAGCPERLSFEFLAWIWTYPARRRGPILERLSRLQPGQRVVVLSSAAEVDRFFESLAP